jgi:hypothetical protein
MVNGLAEGSRSVRNGVRQWCAVEKLKSSGNVVDCGTLLRRVRGSEVGRRVITVQ